MTSVMLFSFSFLVLLFLRFSFFFLFLFLLVSRSQFEGIALHLRRGRRNRLSIAYECFDGLSCNDIGENVIKNARLLNRVALAVGPTRVKGKITARPAPWVARLAAHPFF